jgi:uncharacterized iron-regulated protein
MNFKFYKRARAFRYFLIVLFAIFLFIQYFNGLNSVAQPIIKRDRATGQPSDRKQEIIAKLRQSDVIYLAENHDSVEDHAAQLEIITKLYQSNQQAVTGKSSDLTIALEMFQRPFQPILNRYLAGEINENQLRKQTEYDTRWGFDWEYYAPVIRFAKVNQIPLLAINTPTEITRKVGEKGLDSLAGNDWCYIPPLKEIKTDNQEYRQRMQEIYTQHVHGGQGNSDRSDLENDFENFFAAQVLWDETMADAIAQNYKNNPQSPIVVLVGSGHIVYGQGIHERVARRITDNSFEQSSVLLGKENNSELNQDSGTDFIWNF